MCLCGTASAEAVHPEQLFRGCLNLSTLRSAKKDQVVDLNFLNRTEGPVNIYRIDPKGTKQLRGTIGPAKTFDVKSSVGEAWVVTERHGDCLGAFSVSQSQGIVVGDERGWLERYHPGSSYDAVLTWPILNAPTLECFRFHSELDLKTTQTVYYDAFLFCTELITIISYDHKVKYF
jgi:hypothetical protein